MQNYVFMEKDKKKIITFWLRKVPDLELYGNLKKKKKCISYFSIKNILQSVIEILFIIFLFRSQKILFIYSFIHNCSR